MKRIVSLILLFTITCLSITYVAHGAVSGSIDGNGENHIKIISLPIEFNGKCDDKISVYSLTHDKGLNTYEAGPQSFYVRNDNEVYIIDSTNNRIMCYKNNILYDTIPISTKINRPLDIYVVNDNRIILLGENYKAYVINNRGEILELYDIPIIDHNAVTLDSNGIKRTYNYLPTNIKQTNGQIIITFNNQKDYILSNNELKLIDKVYTAVCNEKSDFYILNNNDNTKISFSPFSSKHKNFGLAIKAVDNEQRTYVENLQLINTAKNTVETKVYINVISKGEITGTISLLETGGFGSHKDYYISGFGEIYQMIVNKDRLEIFFLKPSISFVDNTIFNKSSNVENTSGKVEAAGTHSTWPDRDTWFVFSRMITYASYPWTYNSDDNGDSSVVDDPSKLLQPYYLSNLNNGEDHRVKGIPYCWGGYDSSYTSSNRTDWDNFLDAINLGKYAGNTSSAYGNYMPGTAGLDCSGYICAIWELGYPKRGTMGSDYDIYNLSKMPGETDSDSVPFKQISASEISGFDILNRVSHVMVIDTIDGNDLYVYESTSGNGGNVQKNIYTKTQVFSTWGYTPYRYRPWAD